MIQNAVPSPSCFLEAAAVALSLAWEDAPVPMLDTG